MKLIVISPEAEDVREQSVLAQLFAAGLTSYHLRKPTWGRDALVAFLRAVPVEFHSRIVLHTHHDLASGFSVGGLHFRDKGDTEKCHQTGDTFPAGVCSRAVHSITELRGLLDARARLLFSPVFASISKPGYGPAFDHEELRSVLALPRRAEVIALGGIDASRIPACGELGFDGVAVLGAMWQAADPVRAFTELQNALHAHAA